jgi:hypothetical protein
VSNTAPNSIADALDQWSPKLLDLIPWLDMIDKVALNAGRPDLAATEMQDDLRQMSADVATAARLLREQADELDGVGPDGTGWVVTPGTESDQEIDLGGGWWAEAGPDEDRWAWSVWDQWTRAEGSFPLATGFSHTEAGAKSDALATYRRLRLPA